jgi:RNA polymerase sigma-70 factor (ECF subfamily)
VKKKIILNPGLSRSEVAEFELLVKSNMKRAYYAALGFLGSHDSAMELSQEAFIRAYRNFKNFDNTKKFFTWYYKILRNLCFNYIRDNKKKVSISFLESADYTNDEDDPVYAIEKNEENKTIEAALMQLSFEEREIIILKEFEDCSYKEIADTLDIPIGTVMSRLYYARKKLGQKLGKVLS